MKDYGIKFDADREDPEDSFDRDMTKLENSAKLLIGIVLVCVLVLCVMAVRRAY